MASGLTVYGANNALAAILNQSGLYLAAFTSDPLVEVDFTSVEVDEGGYVRQPVTFAAIASRTGRNTNSQTYLMPNLEVTHLGVCTSQGGGALIVSIELPTPLTPADNGSLVVMAGDLAISL